MQARLDQWYSAHQDAFGADHLVVWALNWVDNTGRASPPNLDMLDPGLQTVVLIPLE